MAVIFKVDFDFHPSAHTETLSKTDPVRSLKVFFYSSLAINYDFFHIKNVLVVGSLKLSDVHSRFLSLHTALYFPYHKRDYFSRFFGK